MIIQLEQAYISSQIEHNSNIGQFRIRVVVARHNFNG